MIKATWRYIVGQRELLFKYAVVGGSCAVLDFTVLFILTDWVHLHYLVSATFAFILGGFSNYWLNKHWTFKSDGQHRKQLPIFFTLATMGLVINNYILYLSVEHFHFHYLWGKVLAAGIVLFWNFSGNKYLTFRIK